MESFLNEIKIRYQSQFIKGLEERITGSTEAAEMLRALFDPDTMDLREEFIILFLNRGNRPISFFRLSSGGINGTVADPKLIFMTALKTAASGIILAHNHPSGNLKPSEADIRLTKKVQNGANFFDISVLDHLIFTSSGQFSFADEGIL